ncbi:hypothetical protein TPHA_0D04080 [Tetrapisispora phaffii CBS 4417]|uniref:SURF1-like protein n=1 Tax=Tetrapisispora phaffii (strain ATCC 24235 / CBS 4417 / NBRC 1672 / NRRL Y-8282 / UCD 70-5) TaxID=1071381 RepID=G8BT70_TETPH|nr:hypothetical protein TPHA_0D04080 [Tetrapisispora phaffii CBS 4417]CCE63041.1 hypothetical protein TPHA_0D04080 [Tetrapisispora phaffii CBS 4417]
MISCRLPIFKTRIQPLLFKGTVSRLPLINRNNSNGVKQFNRTVITSIVDWKPLKSKKRPDEDEAKSSGIGKKIVLGLMFAMPIISFYLGTWQLRRLAWKNKLIASCEDRLSYKVIPLPAHFKYEDCENWEYRRVSLKGHYVHQEEMFVGPRVKNGFKGYVLYTPFIREDTGEKMIIERGWISEEKVAPSERSLRHLSLPQGTTEIVCLVRVPKHPSSMQWEKADKNSRVWEVADIFDMAKVTNSVPVHLQFIYDMTDHVVFNNKNASNNGNLSWSWEFWQNNKNDSPVPITSGNANANSKSGYTNAEVIEFSEEQFRRAGVPIGKLPKIDFKNNHLQYIVTWYGLTFLSSIFLIVALVKMRKGNTASQAALKKEKLNHAKKYM